MIAPLLFFLNPQDQNWLHTFIILLVLSIYGELTFHPGKQPAAWSHQCHTLYLLLIGKKENVSSELLCTVNIQLC